VTPAQKLLTSTPTAGSLIVLANCLRQHNKWRRGEPPYDKPGESPIPPKPLGNTIDRAAEVIQALAEFRGAIPTEEITKAWEAKMNEEGK